MAKPLHKHPHASNSVPTRTPVEPMLSFRDSTAGLIILLQPRDGEMGMSPGGEEGPSSSGSLWDPSSEGVKLPLWCIPQSGWTGRL